MDYTEGALWYNVKVGADTVRKKLGDDIMQCEANCSDTTSMSMTGYKLYIVLSYCGGHFYSRYKSYETFSPNISGGTVLLGPAYVVKRWGYPMGNNDADLGGFGIKYAVVLADNADNSITVSCQSGEQYNRVALIGLVKWFKDYIMLLFDIYEPEFNSLKW